MMKCEAGKGEVRINREAVFFKPLFYFANQCPESTFGCHCRHDGQEVKENERVYACVCIAACVIAAACLCTYRALFNVGMCTCTR